MKDKSKLVAIILVIVTVLVLTAIFNKVEENKETKINIVTNYSNFYTVNSCLYRMVTYIYEKDQESLLLILNDKYKEENNIDENNVLNFFDSIEEDSTFVSKKMYYQNINKNITKYYVHGYIEKNQIFDYDLTNKLEIKDVYYIVYLDSENKIFSIDDFLFTQLNIKYKDNSLFFLPAISSSSCRLPSVSWS